MTARQINKVCIVIPTFDAVTTIAKVIEQMLGQYPQFAIIVVDDGSRDGTMIITLGADDQREARDVGRLVDLFRESDFDAVIGSKFLLPANRIPGARKVGNRLITWLFNRVFRSGLSHVTSGFRIFSADAAQYAIGLARGYDFDVDFYSELLLRGKQLGELPVHVRYHSQSSRMKSVTKIGLLIAFRILNKRLVWSLRKRPPPHFAQSISLRSLAPW